MIGIFCKDSPQAYSKAWSEGKKRCWWVLAKDRALGLMLKPDGVDITSFALQFAFCLNRVVKIAVR
jgi:hypothetical protein